MLPKKLFLLENNLKLIKLITLTENSSVENFQLIGLQC